MTENGPKIIQIKVFYDGKLREITGKNEEIIWGNQGMLFAFLLLTIFSTYQEIEKKYPPGRMGFLLNGKRPGDFDALQDGDKIVLRPT